jgi:hypothetical protein
MGLVQDKLNGIATVRNVYFSEDLLEANRYFEDYRITKCLGNFCDLAQKSFESGLLKDFQIKGIDNVKGMRLAQIKKFTTGVAYKNVNSESGYMIVTLVYKAWNMKEIIYFACRNKIVFPVLLKLDEKSENSKILLSPYLERVQIWKNSNLEELKKYVPSEEDEFYFTSEPKIVDHLNDSAIMCLESLKMLCKLKDDLVYIDNGSEEAYHVMSVSDLVSIN